MITGRNFTIDQLRGDPIAPVIGPITIHPTQPISAISPTSPIRVGDPLKPFKTSSAPTTVNPSGTGGIPKVLLSIQAVQTPLKEQSQTACLVTVNFTHATDPNFDHVNIWITGYHGNFNPVLVASSSQSPISFVLDSTQNTITVYGQTASALGLTAPIGFALSTTVTLSGIVSAPPAPTISQSLVGTSTGFQFGFNQVILPANDQEVIACYKVYRSSSNAFNTSSLIQTIVPTPALIGAITVTDTIMAATGVSYYYWVTATNTAGFESTATAAQGSATPGSVGSTPFSITGAFTYTSTSSSITWSWSSFNIYRSDGTSTNVGSGTQPVTGLSASTTYYFFPYWDDVAQVIGWVAGGTGSPAYAQTASTLLLVQQMNYRNRIPLSVGGMSAATPSSGSGGGSGGGGGGGGGGKQFY